MPLTWVLATLAGGCTPQDDVIPTLRAVSLPDLSRLAESVQDQVRERHALLMETREERGTPPVELGNDRVPRVPSGSLLRDGGV